MNAYFSCAPLTLYGFTTTNVGYEHYHSNCQQIINKTTPHTIAFDLGLFISIEKHKGS